MSRAAGRLGLLLAPGAGADRDQATLVALDRAVTAAGATVVRMDFPYRKVGRRAPDRPAVLLRSVETEAAALAGGPLVLGGRSVGGRICSMAVAEGGAPRAAGLLLVSYPLHPPGKPDRLRTGHFPSITVPCLFVSGTRDAFGSPAELEEATSAIAGPVVHHWMDRKDHSLRGVDAWICEVALDWLRGLGLVQA
ncbi:MAG TPA: alpha/beta family hydrolase [Acidimicrobiales bacterium]|nr:alpha/beta family hydrolase [Acidimicrobiales bacterium]